MALCLLLYWPHVTREHQISGLFSICITSFRYRMTGRKNMHGRFGNQFDGICFFGDILWSHKKTFHQQ